MEKFKKLLSLVLAVAMVFAMAGCSGGDTTEPTEQSDSTGEAAVSTYTVSLQTAGGMALPGIDVYIYADETLADMKDFGQTDENGRVSFQLAEGVDYAISLSGVAKGYDVQSSYAFSGKNAEIVG